METRTILIFILCLIILFVFGKRLFGSIKIAFKLIFNSLLGGLLIFIINTIGTSFNFHIGLNIINSLIVAILGLPRSCIANNTTNILQHMIKNDLF